MKTLTKSIRKFMINKTIDPTELSKKHTNKIFQNFNALAPFTSTEKKFNLIKDSKMFVIEKN